MAEQEATRAERPSGKLQEARSGATSKKVPANLQPYVEVLGEELAIEFFLKLGGAQIGLSKQPRRSMLTDVVGVEKAAELGKVLGHGYVKVPLAKKWVAARLLANRKTIAEIARTVRSDEATVRRWLGPAPASRQFSLFD